MLYHLLYPLKNYSIIFNLFGYITFRASYAGITSAVIVFLFGEKFIRFLKRKKVVERISEDIPERHKIKEGTPTMGGLLIVISSVISIFLWGNWTNPFLYAALFGFLSMAFLGIIDDIVKFKGIKKKGLNKKVKLAYQTIVGMLLFIFSYYLFGPSLFTKTQMLFFKNILVPLGILYIPFIISIFVGTTNSVNLADGLDGLAVGVSTTVIFTYIVLAYAGAHKGISEYLHILFIPKSWELVVFGASILGSLIGFLWFNTYPARIFMGDTGSQAIGGALAVLAILTKQEFLLPISGGIFVIEAISVLLQIVSFRTRGKRIFLCAPLHHHFEKKGLSEPQIVVRFWLISLIFALLAISTLKIR